ncbi:RNA polymerase sigma factor (sigma-70 family) [Thermocatellispora tengchongensis]|uniref:RNA polymerase sigma factor (Sigma-70 family) n=1 Tax=Thermocatellispora tengchongensis TaxID=1073253 RepID=A0A840PAC9_9ACTN|nr:sigma-70 family RNA polymerase sigma factor [Thermocatellispora tengchongensis]MBB5132955.1 RNA polymerase sigma factor (sigma-70 family) [Thermocatellispora tengchongensis]
MTGPDDDGLVPADAELIRLTREGDQHAYSELYRRYAGAARACARSFAADPHTVDDLVAESFARVLSVLRRGKGPSSALFPYLRATIKNIAYEWAFLSRRTVPIGEHGEEDLGYTDIDWAWWSDNQLIRRAFQSLPARWRLVLWRTAVEGETPSALAETLGLKANAVAALAVRAREGLRLAYLRAHINAGHRPECRDHALQLAAHVRRPLGPKQRRTLEAHLLACASCRRLEADLREVNSRLGELLAPLTVGAGGAGGAAGLTAWLFGAAPGGWLSGLAAGVAILGLAGGLAGDRPTVPAPPLLPDRGVEQGTLPRDDSATRGTYDPIRGDRPPVRDAGDQEHKSERPSDPVSRKGPKGPKEPRKHQTNDNAANPDRGKPLEPPGQAKNKDKSPETGNGNGKGNGNGNGNDKAKDPKQGKNLGQGPKTDPPPKPAPGPKHDPAPVPEPNGNANGLGNGNENANENGNGNGNGHGNEHGNGKGNRPGSG